jgi:hypothetical protein
VIVLWRFLLPAQTFWRSDVAVVEYLQQDMKREGMRGDYCNYPLNFEIVFDNN